MKTRNSTHAALAQPEISWSRNRSVRMVIRIQIQITKKKISKASRRASPRLISARGKGVLSVEICAAPTLHQQAPCEQHGGDRGGEIEAGDALAHRDRQPGVGAVE